MPSRAPSIVSKRTKIRPAVVVVSNELDRALDAEGVARRWPRAGGALNQSVPARRRVRAIAGAAARALPTGGGCGRCDAIGISGGGRRPHCSCRAKMCGDVEEPRTPKGL